MPEREMAEIANVFGFEMSLAGARVIVVREPICSRCLSEAEVDFQLRRLKDNLDAVARQMKTALRAQTAKPTELDK
jgi:hypothetical protein